MQPHAKTPEPTLPAPCSDEAARTADEEVARATPAASSHVERLAPLLAGLALALPSVVARYPPMTDLALHEGAMGVLVHHGDPSLYPPGMYSLNLGHPNQLFYVLGAPLALALGTDWACKLLIAATQVLIMTGGARVADHLGRSRWGALLLAPLALGFTYYWGLVTNLVGFAALLHALPALDRFAAQPRPRSIPAILGWLALLFFSHESVFVVGVGILVTFTFLRPLSRRETLLRLAPIAAAGVGVLIQHPLANRNFTRGALRPEAAFLSFFDKVEAVPNVLFGAHEPIIRFTLLSLALCALIALIVGRRADHGPSSDPPADVRDPGARVRRLRAQLLHYRFEALAVAFLLAYFAAPYNWNGATMLHERFLAPAWAFLAVCAAPRGHPSRIAKLAAAGVPAGILLLAWPQFVDSDHAYRTLDPILAAIPKNRATVVCAMEPAGRFSSRVYWAAVGPSRSLAVRGGRAGASLMLSPIAPAQMRRERRWNDFELRLVLYGSRALKPAHDLRMFEYVVAQSRDPETRRYMAEALEPEADVVTSNGEWTLFRSKLPVVPVDAPDRPAPHEMETLENRVRFLAAHYRGDTRLPRPPGLVPRSPSP